MKNLQHLVASLERKYNPDYWSDIERFKVSDQLDSLEDLEWGALCERSLLLNQEGQVYLAEACGVNQNTKCIPVLEALIKSDSFLVGATVSEVLWEKQYLWKRDVPLLDDLRRHHENAGEYEQKMIERLMKRMIS